MDFKVLLSPEALGDLDDITAFVAGHDPKAAVRLGDALLDLAESLSFTPHRGRIVAEFKNPRWRELIYRSYRIIYRVNSVAGLWKGRDFGARRGFFPSFHGFEPRRKAARCFLIPCRKSPKTPCI